MRGNSRMSVWFAVLVTLSGSVFLFEYVVYFNSDLRVSLDELQGPAPLRKLHRRSDGGGSDRGRRGASRAEESGKRLAVIVPSLRGDLLKVLNSLARWPSTCHPSTRRKTDLVMYYAGGEEDDVSLVLPTLKETGGRCFAETRLVLAKLRDEENVYPTGASVQFYKMYLDPEVSQQLAMYDPLAVIEWDVIVAHDSSFAKLYAAAFGSVEPFWMKGSTLAGVDFHETAILPENHYLLGHINGNAIYNNTDPDFVEFIRYTLARWEYTQSYDVALWSTISDFPYSWPLWQRYFRKFVSIGLIANVGFLDVDGRVVSRAVASDTLFIHGSLTSGGGSMFQARGAANLSPFQRLRAAPNQGGAAADGCMASCGREGAGASTVCDRSCRGGANIRARFGGWMCGAGDAAEYGPYCRSCFKDVEVALAVEKKKDEQETMLERGGQRGRGQEGRSPRHVIMCDTLLPPPSPECTSKCKRKSDTVCDTRCGSGRYGDYHCNWRGYGSSCRFCFTNRMKALNANEAAKRTGGAVIMCHTYEPPTEVDEWEPAAIEKATIDIADSDSGDVIESDNVMIPNKMGVKKDVDLPAHMEPYVKDVVRGQLCTFMMGFAPFVLETKVAVESIVRFMPGMRIAIAAHFEDVPLFERTIGGLPGVLVSEAESPISLSPLMADRHCGDGTRLILYLNTGEMLSRSITSKDTHSFRGDLLVAYTDVERVGQASVDRTLATMSVLGFSSPSFSFGMDIMLPAEINQQLRDLVVMSNGGGGGGGEEAQQRKRGRTRLDEDARAVRAIAEVDVVFVPEVLAALAYSRNLPGVWFINPQQWVTHHMFQRASIWDIPLVKPRFGCAFDITLSMHGYDVAAELRAQLGHFVSGGKCDRGFVALQQDALRPKPSVEYGFPTSLSMPSLDPLGGPLGVSVVFHVRWDVNPDLLDASLASVAARFPGAAEVVIVFAEPPRGKKRLREVIRANDQRAPFPVGAVAGQGLPVPTIGEQGQLQHVGGGGSGVWSGLRADEHCSGEFVMQLEAGDIIVEDVTYDSFFHFGKPVVPFTRLNDAGDGGGGGVEMLSPVGKCITKAMEFVTGHPAVRDFALFTGRIYPRGAHGALRQFVADAHGRAEAEAVLRLDRTACGGTVVVPEVSLAQLEMSLMGSFLWNHMHDAIHGRALHRLDVQPDEWPVDVSKYNLVCSIGQFGLTGDGGAASRLAQEARKVDSRSECTNLQARVADWRYFL